MSRAKKKFLWKLLMIRLASGLHLLCVGTPPRQGAEDTVCWRAKELENVQSKRGRTQSLLTGFNFGGSYYRVARRVAGAAAGGAQRCDGGGVTFNLYIGSSVLADDL